MSATTDFLENPGKFMASNIIMTPAGGHYGLEQGDGSFELERNDNASVLLRPKDGGGTFIPGFYAAARPDGINPYFLPDGKTGSKDYFMFTDLLNGCQFLAYGNRHQLKVEHNNFISSKTPEAHYGGNKNIVNLLRKQYEVYFCMTAAFGNHDLNEGFYDPAQGLNIIGVHTMETGWGFFIRDRCDQGHGGIFRPY